MLGAYHIHVMTSPAGMRTFPAYDVMPFGLSLI
jgi:hypothetical protein